MKDVEGKKGWVFDETLLGGKRTSIRVYENIVIKQEWIDKLNLQSLYENIKLNDL